MPATSAPDWTRPCVAHLRRVWAHPGLINTGARRLTSMSLLLQARKSPRRTRQRRKAERSLPLAPPGAPFPGHAPHPHPHPRSSAHAACSSGLAERIQGTPVPRECLSTTVMGRNESEHRHKGLKGRAVSAASAHVRLRLMCNALCGRPRRRGFRASAAVPSQPCTALRAPFAAVAKCISTGSPHRHSLPRTRGEQRVLHGYSQGVLGWARTPRLLLGTQGA
jgi:hypothetical protein